MAITQGTLPLSKQLPPTRHRATRSRVARGPRVYDAAVELQPDPHGPERTVYEQAREVIGDLVEIVRARGLE